MARNNSPSATFTPNPPPRVRPKPFKAALPAHYIQFFGVLTNGTTKGTTSHQFAALAQAGVPPSITDGFAQWGTINRSRRVGMTVLQGYNPIQLTVPIQFEAVIPRRGYSPVEVERDIEILEWMGGRGKQYAADGNVFAPGEGDSPLVNVFSVNGGGNQTNLIPSNCHNLDFVVSGISYDTTQGTGVIIGPDGNRRRQVATVTLLQYVGAPGTSADSAATRAALRADDQGKYSLFPITDAVFTYKLIAVKDAHNASHAGAVAIKDANKSDGRFKSVRSIHDDLRRLHGVHVGSTKVRVPKSVIQHA